MALSKYYKWLYQINISDLLSGKDYDDLGDLPAGIMESSYGFYVEIFERFKCLSKMSDNPKNQMLCIPLENDIIWRNHLTRMLPDIDESQDPRTLLREHYALVPVTLRLEKCMEEMVCFFATDAPINAVQELLSRLSTLIDEVDCSPRIRSGFRRLDDEIAFRWSHMLRLYAKHLLVASAKFFDDKDPDLLISIDRGISPENVFSMIFQARILSATKRKDIKESMLIAESWDDISNDHHLQSDPYAFYIAAYSSFPKDFAANTGLKWLKKAMNAHPDSDSLFECYYLFSAYTAIDHEQYEDALAMFDHILTRLPKAVEVYRGKGNLLAQMNRNYEAMQCITKATRLQPDNADAYRDLAEIYYVSGYLREAKRIAQKCLSINPHEADCFLILGLIFSREEKYENAEKYISRALELHPNDSVALNELSYVEQMLGNNKRASRLAKRAFDIAPDSVDSIVNYAFSCYMKENYNKCIVYLKKALDIVPNQPEIIVGLGHAYLALGAYEEAMEWFEQALEIDDQNPDAIIGKADTLSDMGLHDEAAEYYELAKSLGFDQNDDM